jgi:hypothetical protein
MAAFDPQIVKEQEKQRVRDERPTTWDRLMANDDD